MRLLLRSQMYFSYSQFFVYDKSLLGAPSKWTDEHIRQGFARRPGAVAVSTLFPFGEATVEVSLGSEPSMSGFERAIAVQLEVQSEGIGVDGPDEYAGKRICTLPNGIYRLTVAQRDAGSDSKHERYREEIRLHLEPLSTPMTHSEILVQDPGLFPPAILLEDAEQP